jgi:hypothetical protein
MSYNGVILNTQAARQELMKGEVVTSDDRYCITAPTFGTSHPKICLARRNSGYWQVHMAR